MKILVTTRSTLLKLLTIMMASSWLGMEFYGMPLLVGSLAPNLYLSMVYNALVNLPASIASYFLMVHINRRISLVALAIFCGIANLLCVFRGINSHVQLAAEVSISI
ncbi:organic cation/carnitine transporter 3-like protein [Carex littledalei]|uniref:Organic cation/carnitine transporter 3-like protein n=1 Tax=Carex littledalei TaxID=544730 RepID=A0A833RC13_9POAL|nr:organic cation/carnitine transporter 3-like protein [Carex littledalei]